MLYPLYNPFVRNTQYYCTISQKQQEHNILYDLFQFPAIGPKSCQPHPLTDKKQKSTRSEIKNQQIYPTVSVSNQAILIFFTF